MIKKSSPKMYKLAKKYQTVWIILLFVVISFTGFHTNNYDQTAYAKQESTTVAQHARLQLAPEKSDPVLVTPVSEVAVAPQAAVVTATIPVATPAPAAVPISVKNQLSLQISSIGLNIPLGKTSLDSTGHLKVPANPQTAAWYAAGPVIGQRGTALVTGHLDSAAGPGVFINLRKIKVGDQIRVTHPDGSVATFNVDKLESYGQDATFPWSQVYSTTAPASLRIITCDGVYNSKTGHYSKNLVVYASLTSLD